MFDWFHFLELDVEHYKSSLHRRIREAYLAAYSVLEREHRKGQEQTEQYLDAATDEEDISLYEGILSYEEDRWADQTEALAAMALALLASLNKSFLDEQKNLMNKTHPPAPNGYKGKSQLLKQVTEYEARFGLNLDKIDEFETVREVELARHCCLHKESHLTEDYRTQTKQRLVGNRGDIDMKPGALDLFIEELSKFADSLFSQMQGIRTRGQHDDRN
jgi:hypothetical protein